MKFRNATRHFQLTWAPMILLHTAIQRKTAAGQAPWSTAAFTGGYLVAWAGFCLVAAALQWAFEATGVLSPMMLNSTSALFAAGILFFAGLYQLTPIKQACLRYGRSPLSCLGGHWRPGNGYALSLAVSSGAF